MKHRIIVGNVGVVYDGEDELIASDVFETYKDKSKRGTGRAGYEPVTWLVDGEVRREFDGLFRTTRNLSAT